MTKNPGVGSWAPVDDWRVSIYRFLGFRTDRWQMISDSVNHNGMDQKFKLVELCDLVGVATTRDNSH